MSKHYQLSRKKISYLAKQQLAPLLETVRALALKNHTEVEVADVKYETLLILKMLVETQELLNKITDSLESNKTKE